MGTVLEGDWEPVMAIVRKCHNAAMENSGRVLTSIKIDDRRGMFGRLDKKLESVEQKLGMILKK